MCGIAGWFSRQINDESAHTSLKKMASAIAHRGPDGEGNIIQQHAAFAHRRLAIIGLQSGAQPMYSADQHCVITFNGEIYNYQALKDTLIAQGCRFLTDSDTEVILQLYLTEGVSGFAKLRGMYAFALWDSIERTGYLVRDPLGIKPLFYRQTADHGLEFGSEAKAIIARNNKSQLSEQALHMLLNFRYLPDQSSLFSGIEQLEPGGILQWTPLSVQHIERLPLPLIQPPVQSLVNQETVLAEALYESVSVHTVSDVEVGAYLSGGMDSASIVAMMQRHQSSSFRTFTVNIGDDPLEAQHAARTAELLGVENICADVTDQAQQRLKKLIWHLELPKINSLQVSTLAQHAAKHVKVALSGLGGDELFLGYNAHRWMSWCSQAQKRAGSLISLLGTMAHPIVHKLSSVDWSEFERTSLIAKHIQCTPTIYGLFRNVWDSPQAREQIYGPRMLDQNLPDAFSWLDRHWPEEQSPLVAMRTFEWQRKMVNDLLWQEDRCSMAEGLEVRVPFVDSRMMGHSWLLTPEQLMPGSELKGLLKKTISTVLPDEILQRKKSGFQVDAPAFFRQELMGLADQYLNAASIKKYALFNPEFVKTVLALNTSKYHRWHYFMLYLMIGAHMWIELFEEGDHAFSH